MLPRLIVASSMFLAACGGARATGPAENRGVAGGGCLPPEVTAKDSYYHLVTSAGQAHLCGGHISDDGAAGPTRCWAVDLATGAVAPSALVKEDERADLTAAFAGDQIQIAGPDGKVVRSFPFLTGADNGPSAAGGDPRIVGDVVFVPDMDAGPHADLHMWRLDGTVLGPVRDLDDHREYGGEFELYNGEVSVLSDHDVVFSEHRLTRVIALDTRTMRTTTWKRALPDVPGCSQESVDLLLSPVDEDYAFALEDGTLSRACLDGLIAAHARFRDGGVARAEDGALVALTRDERGAALAHLAPGGRIGSEVPLPMCAP